MTTGRPLRLLLVEDSEDDALLLADELESAGYALTMHRVQTPEQLRAALTGDEWDIVISDDNLPGFSSSGALTILHDIGRDLPFVIVSGAISEERAVAAMKAGAHDYVMKGNRLRLLPAIERELADAEQRRARRAAEAALKQAADEYLAQLERRVAERTAELERAQHAKEELLATVSHELRTPLASMLGALELLQGTAVTDDQRRQLMDITLGEGQRLRALIENFLSLQRMEHGWHAITPRPTETRALLAQAAQGASDGRHLIRVESEDDLPDVLVDLDQVQLVLANLLSNARKYAPPGTTLHLQARTVSGRAPAVEIAVRDEGIGIPPESLPRLFERFYRVADPAHRAVPGTGLGLSICQRIVTAHGGRIWAESDGPGTGTTIRFTLPAAAGTGDITFLFTDIEGSTRLWERHPDWMRNALKRHDVLLRREIDARGGHIFKTMGDAFCVAFRDPAAALEATIAIQHALLAEPWDGAADDVGAQTERRALRVRTALHTGVVQERDGDYFGQPLNRVARLLAAGHGGQILLSQVTADLLRDHLPAGPGTGPLRASSPPERAHSPTLRDMGERRLKDLTRPERVYQVVAEGLPATFPPLRSLDARRNNLPPQLTQLVGREAAAEEIRQRLLDSATRLLTLTGPGGAGKTRLSLQVAADSVDDFDDGVFFIPLAEIDDPSLVPDAIALALDVREEAARSVRDTLVDALRDQQVLLVL
ncbi:MAG TPA: ATP-binding protein, partial [Chloroflexota bacterium]|nr:ATP-binding protein [Chloroflexota bacterium]